ncbi:UNVERIFIED_CONTAM: Mediator of RNA polymerase II transcription subunit [Sesamum radiatum]|uniref:Mediator of RNA polymerase II transcription subunit n=1 Tax=Sesamum radiatum TaxID=300843 RepID=A0AAW2VAM7_SESRA
MTLRLQFLLRLLPIICADREPSGRNMKHVLASVILRLLGSRVVHEDSCHFVNTAFVPSKRDVESPMETCNAATLLSGESLFDSLLLVLHVLLSSYQPSWLKMKSESKPNESSKDYAVFDRELAESLQQLQPASKNPVLPGRAATSVKTKSHMSQQELDSEIDQWTLLEDGAGSGQLSPNSAGIGGSDHANLKASNFLKGAVRVRRTDLTYIGAVDEDS